MAEAKKRINSKAKGSGYELKTAKILGGWWGEDFHRTPMSGGLHWKSDNRVAGDIVTPPDSVFPFNIECKKREGWTLDQVLKGVGEIEDWWIQCSKDADRVGMKPMLIFARNFVPSCVMVELDDFLPIVKVKEDRLPVSYFVIKVIDKPVRVLLLLDEFIKVVTPQDIKTAYSL